jgi:hypothetical protein
VGQELSAAELSRLEEALYGVLVLVGGADGQVDPKEARRFTQMLEAAKGGDEPLLAGVAGAALARAAERLAKLALDTQAAMQLVREAAALADTRLATDAARRFKLGLYVMGTQLAAASGGGLLGLGARTSADEQKALATLASLLGVQVS